MSIGGAFLTVWGVLATILFVIIVASANAGLSANGVELSTIVAVGGIVFALILSISHGLLLTVILVLAITSCCPTAVRSK